MKKSFFLVMAVLCLLFTSCKKLAIIKAPGAVEQETFKVTYPFELKQGIIIVEVNLKGKPYEFVLDTGGFNLVDQQLAEELDLKAKKSIKIGDSQDNEKEVPIFKLDELEIAGVNFLETGTGIVDFDDLNAVGCLELQGMIGANLMQNAIWEIDYQMQEITISNTINDFNIPDDHLLVYFNTNILASPKVNLVIDGQEEKEVEIDLGSTGGIKLAKSTFDKLSTEQKTKGHGFFSAGLYGYGDSEDRDFAIANRLAFGDVSLRNHLVTFKSSDSPTIGNEFLKNYRVILNWFNKELILIPIEDPTISSLESHGFKPVFKDSRPLVGFIYKDSSADKEGLTITDQIIELNGHITKNINKADWCTILADFNESTQKNIVVKVLRSGQELVFTLIREKLL